MTISTVTNGNGWLAKGDVFAQASSSRPLLGSLSRFSTSISSISAQTALKVAAVSSLIVPVVMELIGGYSSGNEAISANFHNATLVPSLVPGASLLNPSASCIQNIALASLGMILTQSTWSLGGLLSCIPRASAEMISPPVIKERSVSSNIVGGG